LAVAETDCIEEAAGQSCQSDDRIELAVIVHIRQRGIEDLVETLVVPWLHDERWCFPEGAIAIAEADSHSAAGCWAANEIGDAVVVQVADFHPTDAAPAAQASPVRWG